MQVVQQFLFEDGQLWIFFVFILNPAEESSIFHEVHMPYLMVNDVKATRKNSMPIMITTL